MKKLAILFALTLCVALAGCNQPAPGRRTLAEPLRHGEHSPSGGAHRHNTPGGRIH